MASPKAARGVLIALAVLAVLLLARLVHPFAAALFFGAVLAGAFHPWYEALAARLKGHRTLAAALVTVAVILVVLLPISWLTVFVGSEVVDGVNYVRTTLQSEGVSGLIEDLPRPLAELARKGLDRLPRAEQQIEEFAGRQTGRAAAFMGGFLVATGGVVVHVVFMLIAFFFFLVDGPQLLDWLSHAAPLRPEQTRELLGEFRKVSVAVLFSSAANAVIQAAAALLGYLLAGIPQPFFFAFVTFIFAFVPAVGAWSVVVLTGLLAFLPGRHPHRHLPGRLGCPRRGPGGSLGEAPAHARPHGDPRRRHLLRAHRGPGQLRSGGADGGAVDRGLLPGGGAHVPAGVRRAGLVAHSAVAQEPRAA